MISAVSGSNATALLALFGRSQTAAALSPTQPAALASSPPSLRQGNGALPQSLFDALVHAGKDGKDGADKTPLDDFLSQIISSLDTDGDGKLSQSELKSALSNLTGTAKDDATKTDTASTGAAQSLYESLFNAMATEDGALSTATRKDDPDQKFLSLLGS